MTWDPWTSVAEGKSAIRSAITAVPITGGNFTLFVVDPLGGVFTASGNAADGWGLWSSVAQGQSALGSSVTAVRVPGGFTLFAVDPLGGVFTATGSAPNWGMWSSVAQGHAAPGSSIAAVPIPGGKFTLFLADPDGGVFTATGSAPNWGMWSSVAQGHAAPGTSVTAVPVAGGKFTLFLTDPGGGVFTATGSAPNWGMWSSVAGGRAAAGSSVTAVPLAGGGFTLFTVDPTGRVSTTMGSAQSGWGNWTSVADGKAALGSSVCAVPVPGGKFAVFATDPAGEVFTALGNATQGWGFWASVSEGRATIGSSVAAVPTGGEGCRLFAVDPGGGVFTTAGDSSSAIKHVFVLVMENRSFDHMLGFSDIVGTDTQTGRQRKIDGLGGHETNSFKDADGVEHQRMVSMGAPDKMNIGPGHEFVDVLDQLCGSREYKKGDPYPAIEQNGFVASYARVVKNKIADQKAKASALPAPASTAMIQALNQMASHIDPGDVMKCFGPAQLPVLNALAREYVVCDRWFSSMPGPTEPNRWFVHAASAGTFDESPSGPEIARAQGPDLGLVFHGFRFRHGTVFDLLKKAGVKYRIYAGDRFPVVGEIDEVGEQKDFEDFADDLKDGASDVGYFHIEPSYGIVPFSGDADSQHPAYGGAAAGERFIKATYEAIRKSPLWENSLLIIIWDEHGGFYDHVPPPPATRTGETGRGHGFMFDHLGPRVPAVVISPLIPRNMIEHRVFDHTAIPATLSRVFRLPPLGNRDGINGGLDQLVGGSFRVDTPPTLPAAATVTALASAPPVVENAAHDPTALIAEDPRGNLTSVLHSAVVQHLGFAPAEQRAGILARVDGFKTHGEIFAYLKEVEQLVHGGPRKATLALV